jgi:hypothetical protein
MANEPDEENRVGYKRPPRHTQFQTGRSGNPKGRPHRAKNLETDLVEELADRIPIREGDRRFKVSKQRGLIKALVAKALRGDTRAVAIVVQLIAKVVIPNAETNGAPDREIGADDLEIVEHFLARKIDGRRET